MILDGLMHVLGGLWSIGTEAATALGVLITVKESLEWAQDLRQRLRRKPTGPPTQAR